MDPKNARTGSNGNRQTTLTLFRPPPGVIWCMCEKLWYALGIKYLEVMMDFNESKQYVRSQVDKSYERALDKILAEFVVAEDKAIDLLAEAMTTYSVDTAEEMDNYRKAKEAFYTHMETFKYIRTKLRYLEMYESNLKEDLEYSFEMAEYKNTVSDYNDKLTRAREIYNKSK